MNVRHVVWSVDLSVLFSLIDHASGIHKLIVIAQDWIAELIDLSFVYLMRLLIFKKKIKIL